MCHLTMYEICSYMNPKEFTRFKKSQLVPENVEQAVWFRIFQQALEALDNTPISHSTFLELAKQGYLPPAFQKTCVTNDRMQLPHKKEWDIMTVQGWRHYWQHLVGRELYLKLEDTWKKLVFFLPCPEKMVCESCGWSLPSSEMSNKTFCEYCASLEKPKQYAFMFSNPVLIKKKI